MPTKGEVINASYEELKLFLKGYFDENLFPADVDTGDLIYYISVIFVGIAHDGMKSKVLELCEMQGIEIDSRTFEIVFPKILKFINLVKELC